MNDIEANRRSAGQVSFGSVSRVLFALVLVFITTVIQEMIIILGEIVRAVVFLGTAVVRAKHAHSRENRLPRGARVSRAFSRVPLFVARSLMYSYSPCQLYEIYRTCCYAMATAVVNNFVMLVV